jgi:dienelactone hydrolase
VVSRCVMSQVAGPLMPTLVALALFVTACGGGGSEDGYEVRSSVVSHETTQDILVFEPDAEGSWPVVLAFHGLDGNAEQMAEMGQRLAASGHVAFAPNIRTDMGSQQGIVNAAQDAECGYRYARSIAADHGGDIDQPVTFLGWSLGAVIALQAGLDEEIDPTGQYISCFAEVPRPDVIVAVSGCYYEFEGTPSALLTPAEWANDGVAVVLDVGEDETVCAASHSEQATTELRSFGYDVRYVRLAGADHFAPVFHDDLDGEMVPARDEPAGDRTLELVVDAIANRNRG